MSKFTLTKRVDGAYDLAYFHDRMWKYFRIEAADVAALYSCIGAAMAESNTAVMSAPSGKCCDGPDKHEKACEEYRYDCTCCSPPVCDRCGHPRSCHQPQEPAREGNEQ